MGANIVSYISVCSQTKLNLNSHPIPPSATIKTPANVLVHLGMVVGTKYLTIAHKGGLLVRISGSTEQNWQNEARGLLRARLLLWGLALGPRGEYFERRGGGCK